MSVSTPVATLKQLFEKTLRKYADRTAVHFDGEAVTYAELDRRSNTVAHELVNRGVAVGEPVALMLSNSLSYVVVDLALFKAGAARFALNDMLSAKEREYMLDDTRAETVFVDEDFEDTLQNLQSDVDSIKHVFSCSGSEPSLSNAVSYETLLEEGSESSAPDVAVGPTDKALHAYTGGTTGKPKGLVHSHRGMVQNMYTTIMELDVTGDTRQLITTPLPHSAGGFLWSGLLTGAEIWLEPGFNAATVLERIESNEITWTFMVPTMIYRILDHERLQTRDTSSIETIVYGAAPMTSARLREGLNQFGPVFLQFYGQGECPNFITTLTKKEHQLAVATGNEQRLGSAGQPCMMADVNIVDPDTGESVMSGDTGEITVRAPYTMERYFERPEETSQTLVDGWVRTGDIGRIDDDGYVYLLDRKNDMIVTGGMNIYSTEVEETLAEHAVVKDVAVIGVPDEEWGEAVWAVVVPYEDETVPEEALIEYADERLAKYKKPKKIEFREALPRTPYDKVDKVALREPYWEHEDRSIS